ncbi:ribonuclease H-like domain-containing protein [Tanacetum coccineum]
MYDKAWLDNGNIVGIHYQSNISLHAFYYKLDVQNGQPVAGERMVIVMEEICPVLTILETRSITKTLNVMIESCNLIRGGSEQSHVSIPSLRVCMCGLCRPPGILSLAGGECVSCQVMIEYSSQMLGLKRLHGFLEVTAAQCCWWKDYNCLKTFYCQEDKEDMELESTNIGPTAKLPILKLGEYKMWAIRINYPDVKSMFAAIETRFGSVRDNTKYAFIVENPNGSNVLHQDLEQIHEDDLEAMDLKWQLSLLSVRAKKYYQRTGKKIFINGNDIAGYDKSKVECYNCHKLGHFTRECTAPRSKEGQFRNQDNTRKQGNNEDTSKAMLAIDGVGFDWSDMAEEQVQTNMALMAFSDSEVYTNKTCSKTCLKNYETLKKQYDDLLAKLHETEFKGATYIRVQTSWFEGYRPKDTKNVNDGALIIEDWVSDDEEQDESKPKSEKKSIIPTTAKKEFAKPENHENPLKRSVSLIVTNIAPPKLGRLGMYFSTVERYFMIPLHKSGWFYERRPLN